MNQTRSARENAHILFCECGDGKEPPAVYKSSQPHLFTDGGEDHSRSVSTAWNMPLARQT